MELMNKTIEDTSDEPFELLIVYSQDLISRKGEVKYQQMWDGDYVDDFASTCHMDVLSMRLPLQAPIPSDTSSAGLHWAYYQKCDALIANANAGQISLATARALIMGGDYLETDDYDDPYLNQVAFAELEEAGGNVLTIRTMVYNRMLARFAALAVPDHQMYLGYQVQELGSKHLADRHDHQSFKRTSMEYMAKTNMEKTRINIEQMQLERNDIVKKDTFDIERMINDP